MKDCKFYHFNSLFEYQLITFLMKSAAADVALVWLKIAVCFSVRNQSRNTIEGFVTDL